MNLSKHQASVSPEPVSASDKMVEQEPHHEKVGHPPVIYAVAICATLGGLLFGYDTGIINGALILLDHQYDLSDTEKGTIVSSTVGAAAIFALFAGATADQVGRKLTIMCSALIFVLGGLFMGFAPNQYLVLVGRLTVGASIGFVSCIVPVYVSECAPYDIRGRLITMNQLFITIGILCSAILAGALQSLDELGWRLMLGIAVVPGVIQFIMFICLPDSPRYMVMKGRTDEAEAVLKRIRNSDDVSQELNEITEAVVAEKDTKGGMKILSKIFSTAHVRRALYIGCMLQLFQQFCGINTVIYYSSSILLEAGFSESQAIWLTTIPFTVNFLATFIGLWAVETLGRKLVLAASFFLIAISLVVLCLSFTLAENNSPEANAKFEPSLVIDPCYAHTTCHKCVKDSDCNFCYVEKDSEVSMGSCVSKGKKGFSTHGRCFGDPDKSGNDTLPDGMRLRAVCPSDYSWLSVVGIILYVLFFAPGAGPMPWTINAEIYPLWARGMANSLATVTNWACNLVVSFTFPFLISSLSPSVTFLMYAAVCIVATVFVLLMVPETKDLTLEEIELLFMTKENRQKVLEAKAQEKRESVPEQPVEEKPRKIYDDEGFLM